MRETVRQSLEAGGLVAVPGVLAWLTGFPFIFPSLGPTAYVLSVRPGAPTCVPRRVVGGHVVGVVAGLLAFSLFDPAVLTSDVLAPASPAAVRIVVSGVLATALTAAGMLATDLRHAPACATTLIVSLGLLSTLPEAVGIVGAVLVLVAVHRLAYRAGLVTAAR